MSAAEMNFTRHQFRQLYMWSLVATGGVIIIISACVLPVQVLDNRFLILCLMAMASSVVAIKIPRVSGRITVADTFVFLTMLLYGGSAAILVSALALLAAVTGFCTGCEAYKLACLLRGRPFVSCPIPGARS